MQNLLDPDDDVHLWCLHLVYLPMINKHLQTWKAAWIHHPIRTEKNKSPMQLSISGLHLTQFGQALLRDNVQDPQTEVNLNLTLAKDILNSGHFSCIYLFIYLFI